MTTRVAWTRDRDEALRRLYGEGRPTGEIARELSTTPGNVRTRAWRLGLARPTMSQDAPKRSVARALREVADGTKGGLAMRLAAIQGLSLATETASEELPDETVRPWVDDPERFFSWLGVTLFEYQRQGLRLIREHDRVVLCWGRQCGKDFVTSLFALWTAIVKPNSTVVCVSPSQRQSDLWMQRVKSFTFQKGELRDSLTDVSQSEMTFSNGSQIHSLPSGQGGMTIRGFSRVSLLLANECAWIDEETLQAVQPFLAVSGRDAKLIAISTPFGESGYFWRVWNSDLFAKSHARTADNPLVPRDFLEKERHTMDSLSYEAEYEARFLSAQSSYFPTDLIARCTEAYPLVESPLPEHQGMRFYLGCDWARIAGGDRTVITILGVNEDGHGRVVWLKPFDGIDYVTQANYVVWLDSVWRFVDIYSDASAFAVNDLLRARGLSVEAVTFSQPSKVELFSRLKAAMEAGRVTIPNEPDLLREISTFRYRISESGNLLLHHSEGGHDDYVDSVALAARAITANPEGDIGNRNVGDLWRAAVEAKSLDVALNLPSGFAEGSTGLSDYDPRVAQVRDNMSRFPRCPKCGRRMLSEAGLFYHEEQCGNGK